VRGKGINSGEKNIGKNCERYFCKKTEKRRANQRGTKKKTSACGGGTRQLQMVRICCVGFWEGKLKSGTEEKKNQ